MCGIVGIVGQGHVNQGLYDALTVLQHRGQDAAGIVTCDNGHFYLRKSNGLVRDVFREKHMQRLVGHYGIGHIRYPTAGTSSAAEAQPLYVNSPYGIAMAHNGNLTNTSELIQEIYASDLRHINTRSDSEALLNVFAHEMQIQQQLRPNPEMIFHAVAQTHKRIRGAYAVLALVSDYGLVAFRDPNGIRPLVFGVRENANGRKEYMVASESVALHTQGYRLVRDVEPGEALVITKEGELFTQVCAEETRRAPCLFEYVYFARPDSTIDGINVFKARLRMGEKLAERILREWPEHDIDVVIPIPDTSRSSAIELANALGVKFREGFMKNRYIGRTFIMPGQALRQKSVRQKLNALDLEFRDKNVLLVDDSIVRGTTSEQIIQMARDAGAKKVYFASAAPPVRFPNVYGIDMPTHEELIAYQREEAEVAAAIGADRMIYQTLGDLIDACKETRHCLPDEFDCSVFNGCYVTGDIDEAYLARILEERKTGQGARVSPIGNKPIDMQNAND
ncbi:amidophosphoribosyltransferase [Suttonella sp. R2A3]|uniref:amidophosphoribosyltransferase n=1 Tax=Suttonella sp. R2A3 TaxID=2908648 RepID=UPI001F421091|nr:amidophosphoribosyltransferase [Suttonella sp. R2A3]UJF24004.1 amidophosphoribosyltransferase [Suttonella sp. R2A3]